MGSAFSGYGNVSIVMVVLEGSHSLLGPLIFATDLILLLGSEVILDIECLTDLLGRLALDHIRDSLAANIKESLNV